MTDKQDAPRTPFALPGWQVLEATGSDATAFLQAQTMNDLRLLAPGQWQWSGWLNAKGRLIALFMLAMFEPQRYWLIAPDFPADVLAERLRRFVFRSKVKLTARADLAARGRFAPPAQARGHAFTNAGDDDGERTEFDLGGDGGARTLIITGATIATTTAMHGDSDTTGNACDEDETGRWLAFDLAHGLPRLPIEQSEQWTPQMLSLERLHAFSLKKGCYPGQEIVARTHFLGKAKRVLVRLSGTTLAVGSEVLADGRVLGSVVSSDGSQALAVLAGERPDAGWICAGLPCHERPLEEFSAA
ncbi:MAG: folate-binding protein YgfZ [Proteobacteria bacterium]|nr:folate-binding protein YgfZ [Pseudomonadota bacterium]